MILEWVDVASLARERAKTIALNLPARSYAMEEVHGRLTDAAERIGLNLVRL